LPDNEKPLKIARKPQIIEPLPELAETTKQIYQYFFDMLELTETGKHYLLSRGLSEAIINQYRIKSIDDHKAVYKQLLAKYTIEQLHKAGLSGISDKGEYYSTFRLNGLIFTIFENEQPIYFSSRNFTADHGKRFYKLAGVKQRYFNGDLSADKIYIFEGLIDALSFYQLTGKNNFIVLTGLDNRKFSEIKNNYPDKLIIAVFDNDQAGIKARNEISENLGYQVPALNFERFKNHFSVQSEKAKDINDILKISQLKAGNKAVCRAVYSSLSELDKEQFEERAGIMEFDGNQTKEQANFNALLSTIGEM